VALLTFPPGPHNNGDLYPITPAINQNQYQWSAADLTWVLLGSGTGVVAGTYGDAFNVPQFTVDAVGRISFAQNVPIAANTPNLQQVTDEGAITTNTIDVAGLVAASLSYPTADGAVGDYLTTDGAGTLGWITPVTPDLQAVTDAGATSTNAIDVAGLTSAGLIYPLVDGASGDYLTTDGAGNLGWLTPTAPTLQTVTTSGNATTNAIDVAGLVAAGLFYPLADGSAGQVMSTDGATNLGWITTAKVVATPSLSTDPGNDNEISFDASGNFYFFKGGFWWKVAGVSF
jgi:hypothetical protein